MREKHDKNIENNIKKRRIIEKKHEKNRQQIE